MNFGSSFELHLEFFDDLVTAFHLTLKALDEYQWFDIAATSGNFSSLLEPFTG